VICSAAAVFCYSSLRILFVIGAAKKALKAYCETLDLTLEHLTIKAVTKPAITNLKKWVQCMKEAPTKYALFCEEFSHF
jgi:predicted AAA+ superfamily ATPase